MNRNQASTVQQSSPLPFLLAGVAVAAGILRAIHVSWTCDDAFISFRYAQNFVNGLGLVFNPGEAVEGYTNFLWTLWIAAGLRFGFPAEGWCLFWAVFFYAGTILLLAKYHLMARTGYRSGTWTIPAAALLAALHPDWNIYATSGLETSLFTFLVFGGFLCLIGRRQSTRQLWLAGFLFALSSLTRPEGVIFASIGGFFILWQRRPAIRSAAIYALTFLSVWIPFLCWRLYYYNDIFPNSYYAKSANLAWFSQGWIYLRLYFQRYWVLLFSLPVLLPFFRSKSDSPQKAESNIQEWQVRVFAFSCAAAYCFYVVRVGGDFMFARMLIPATPFLLILVEDTIHQLRRLTLQIAVLLLCAAAFLYCPNRFSGTINVAGIRNEWFFYKYRYSNWALGSQVKASVLRRYFDGLPVRLSFYGGQARLIYYMEAPVAVECEAGLTDYFTARLPLKKRGMVGHEKKAPLSYMIHERRLHFTLEHRSPYHWNREIPYVPIQFGSVEGRVLHWDPDLLAVLKARGAQFPDFISELDSFISEMDSLPDEDVIAQYRRFKNFYFDFISDPERENKIRDRVKELPGYIATFPNAHS